MFGRMYCEGDGCQLYNTDYTTWFDKIDGSSSWGNCGYLCHLTSGCNYWTWGDESSPYPYTCWFHSSIAEVEHIDGYVCGDKNCYSG